MIKWCAYCLQFIREFEPFDDFSLSHGVCENCLPRVLTLTQADIEAVHEVRKFYWGLQASMRLGAAPDLAGILAESNRLGIRPLDLMMGLFQPLLREVGYLWECGALTTEAEHRFSAVLTGLLAQYRKHFLDRPAPVRPRLLLVNADGNLHNFGQQMAEAYFESHGITTLAVAPGLPTPEVLDLLTRLEPPFLGISVALETQRERALDLAAKVKHLDRPPRTVLAGGFGVRGWAPPDPALGLRVCCDLEEARRIIDQD